MEKKLRGLEALVPHVLAAKRGKSLTPRELAFVKQHLEKRRREAKAKEKPRKQRQCRHSPALVSPFGIPLPRRPLGKEWPKGETHPHFGEKGKFVLAFVVPGGVAQTLRGLP